MRNSKKWISLIFVLVLVFSLAACGNKSEDEKDKDESEEITEVIDQDEFKQIVESMDYWGVQEIDFDEIADKTFMAQKRLSETNIFGLFIYYFPDNKAATQTFEDMMDLALELRSASTFTGYVKTTDERGLREIIIKGKTLEPAHDPLSIPAVFDLYVAYVLKGNAILKVVSYESKDTDIEEVNLVIEELGF